MNQKSTKDSLPKNSQNFLERAKFLAKEPLSKFALSSIIIAITLIILGIIFGILNRPEVEKRIAGYNKRKEVA